MASVEKIDRGFATVELQSIFKLLCKKFSEILGDNKAPITEECRDLLQLLFRGVKPENLHESYKLDTVQFLKQILAFSHVRSLQSDVGFKEKLTILLILKLIYIEQCDSIISTPDFKSKWLFTFLYQTLQRVFKVEHETLMNVVFQGISGFDITSGIPQNSILLLRHTLLINGMWSAEQAGEISKKLGQWLFLYSNQITSPSKKKLFGGKIGQTVIPTTEVDGTASRDIFTVLNINQSYHAEALLNIYCFSMLKCWIQYLHSKDDMVECLTSQLNKLALSREVKSYSGSPVQIGGSKFYDELSSGSNSAGSYSLSSSVSSLHSFMYVDDANDSLEVRRSTDSTRGHMDPRLGDSRPQTPFRKQSQAFDTMSITSDILSTASNLKSIAIRYCLRVINQSEKIPRRDSDRRVITASVIECLEILDFLCSEDSSVTQKVFNEVKRLYQRIEHKPFTARRVFVALIQFFIHHHESMLLQIDEILDVYFKSISNHFQNQTAVFELINMCLKNKQFFTDKTIILHKYFPNVFKLIAWWPCTFLEEICELMDAFVSKSNVSEVFHAILDLPCLAALLYLQHQGVLDDQEKLEVILGVPSKPYYSAMFSFILRDSSGGAETIDKLLELHDVLRSLQLNVRVKYTSDIVPALLYSFFAVTEKMNEPNIVQNLFPVILERVYLLFPQSNDYQNEINDIFANQIQYVVRMVPEIVSLYHEELLIFFNQITTAKLQSVPLISSVIWCIGERATNDSCKHSHVTLLYENIETFIYEVSQQIGSINNILACPEIITSLMLTLAKLAAYLQDLIPRAIVCLNKLSNQSKQNISYNSYITVKTFAQELINILRKPKVAPAILCDDKKLLPWHLDADSSLLLTVHLLSGNNSANV